MTQGFHYLDFAAKLLNRLFDVAYGRSIKVAFVVNFGGERFVGDCVSAEKDIALGTVADMANKLIFKNCWLFFWIEEGRDGGNAW